MGYSRWNQKQIAEVVATIISEGISVLEASSRFGIPRTSINRWINDSRYNPVLAESNGQLTDSNGQSNGQTWYQLVNSNMHECVMQECEKITAEAIEDSKMVRELLRTRMSEAQYRDLLTYNEQLNKVIRLESGKATENIQVRTFEDYDKYD